MDEEKVAKRPLGDVKLNLDFFIHFFCFISVLLIGADRWGVTAFGVNLRLDQIFLVIFAILLVAKNEFYLTKNIWLIGFVVISLLSTVFSVSFARGILYFVSICYNVLFLFYCFASYVRCYGLKCFLGIWRKTCYTQFGILLLQFVLQIGFGYQLPFLENYGYYFGVPRFRIWFYEPSYLANYFIFWFAFSVYRYLIAGDEDYLKDVIIGLLMLILSTSTSGFAGIAFVILTLYLYWLSKGVTLKKLSFPIVIVALLLIFRFGFADAYRVIVARLFSGSLNSASGGRISQWAETWKVFTDNPLFGIGPGCYGIYFGKDNNYVPSNISLELLATLGIFGFLAFYGLTLSLSRSCIKLGKLDRERKSYYWALVYALIVFTLILQVNQGYLRLYHWMFFGIIQGVILYEKDRGAILCRKNRRSV